MSTAMNATATAEELGAFLRARRERLTPVDAGLPERGRTRRTPGLRREEVAELAGVSVDYVVRLEQGRGLRPSPEVLEALARALRLTEDERLYLFDLARQRPAHRGSKPDQTGPLARLVHDLSPLPAMVINHRNDLLAWNAELVALLNVDLDELPDEQCNGIWLCLMHPRMRTFYLDREQVIRESIADLRVAWAAHPDDTLLTTMIATLLEHSEEFARLWAQRDVGVRGRGHKAMLHPEAGRLTIQFEVLSSMQDPDQRLVIYRAADPDSQSVLDTIIANRVPAPR
jgi:transcriptional regulator with XRE-family HTH domain